MKNNEVTDIILNTITNSIGAKLKTARKSKGLTISELAKLSHVSSTVITDLENSRSLPKTKCLIKLSLILNVPLFNVSNTEELQKVNTSCDIETVLTTLGLGNKEKEMVKEFINFLLEKKKQIK